MGLSFSIPMDVAMEVVEQLKEKGSVSRGWLGVQIQRVDRDLAESFGLDRAAGALVTRVFADSPADRAGLEEGDIIIEFGGRAIDLSSDLPQVVGRIKAGAETTMEVVRNGKALEIAVKVGELDAQTPLAQNERPSTPSDNRLGIQVRALAEDEKTELAVDVGVVIVEVAPGPGQRANLVAGDVITSMNNQWLDSVADFERELAELPGGVAIPVRIVRGRQPQFIAIKLDP